MLLFVPRIANIIFKWFPKVQLSVMKLREAANGHMVTNLCGDVSTTVLFDEAKRCGVLVFLGPVEIFGEGVRHVFCAGDLGYLGFVIPQKFLDPKGGA